MDDEIINEFLSEAYSDLEIIENGLVEFEKNPNDKEVIAHVFRCLHSMKGIAGMLEFPRLEKIAHHSESLLDLVRSNELKASEAVINGLFRATDVIKSIVEQISINGAEIEGDDSDVLTLLNLLCEGENTQSEKGEETSVIEEEPEQMMPYQTSTNNLEIDTKQAKNFESLYKTFEEINKKRQKPIETKKEEKPIAQVVEPDKVPVKKEKQASILGTPEPTSIRIDVGLLDKLMDLVGELVLARNQLLTYESRQKDSEFSTLCQGLNLVTTELQDNIMHARMQPVANLWKKFPRIVRDLAIGCGKQIELELEGQDTALDKSLIEVIKDPLTHLIRNAVDHGIEKPEVRKEKGKLETGRIILSAHQSNGQVEIKVTDDGSGIDLDFITEIAIEKGLISQKESEIMNACEKYDLLMHPGFSTAKEVSNISGRGVGMDVVKSNIQKIGGSVEIESELGKGTSFIISIPLTLAILPSLIVECSGIKFAIAQESVIELVRIKPSDIETVHNIHIYRLRGELLSLISLKDVIGIEKGIDTEKDILNVVVLSIDSHRVGCIVDIVRDTQEIVVKPLGKQFNHLAIYSGATILGNGEIALIIDSSGIGEYINLNEIKSRVKNIKLEQDVIDNSLYQYLLLVKTNPLNRIAIPLNSIDRLEFTDKAQVEKAGNLRVVQYNGKILTLIPLAELIGDDYDISSESNVLKVVIYRYNEETLAGIIVSQFDDAVYEPIKQLQSPKRNGFKGSFVIKEKVTELVDVTLLNELISQRYQI